MRPGGGKGTKLGNKLKTGGGGYNFQGTGIREDAPSLESLDASWADKDDVPWLASISAEVGVSAAATFFMGQGAVLDAHAVQIHGNMGLGRRVGAGAVASSAGGL